MVSCYLLKSLRKAGGKEERKAETDDAELSQPRWPGTVRPALGGMTKASTLISV